jgi:hypothetical protein
LNDVGLNEQKKDKKTFLEKLLDEEIDFEKETH